MVDISKISYRVVLVQENGKQLDITSIVESLGWEENDGELAMRINLTLKNEKYSGKNISNLTKLNCIIGIFAKCNGIDQEVARGKIVEWETSTSNAKESLKLTCYDELYDLQKSQDNMYYSSGTGTKAALMKIFDNWKVPVEKYDGPNITHSKMVYKSKALSEIILEILDEAVKKGSDKYIIRSSKGKVSVLPKGSNKVVYHFGEENSSAVQNKWSTSDMITRVKVLGQGDEDGKYGLEVLADAQIQYGIRQKIVISGQDASVKEAKDSAIEILKEKGDVHKTITVQSPDIPVIRKADLVHITSGSLNGYYFVKGIRHNADSMTMSMDLTSTEEKKVTVSSDKLSGEFHKGDAVILNGAVYVDSYGNGKGRTFNNYKGKITIKVDTKRPCPYHVDHIGWVYPKTIEKV